jgi:hypothetical protein
MVSMLLNLVFKKELDKYAHERNLDNYFSSVKTKYEQTVEFYEQLIKTDPEMAKVQIQNFAKALFYKRFIDVVSSVNDRELSEDHNLYSFLCSCGRTDNSVYTITPSSCLITSMWHRGRLSSCLKTINVFNQDITNHKGFYIVELDLLCVHNGNHSSAVGALKDIISLKTDDQTIIAIKLDTETFSSAAIYPTVVIYGKGQSKKIREWEISAFLRIIQLYIASIKH